MAGGGLRPDNSDSSPRPARVGRLGAHHLLGRPASPGDRVWAVPRRPGVVAWATARASHMAVDRYCRRLPGDDGCRPRYVSADVAGSGLGRREPCPLAGGDRTAHAAGDRDGRAVRGRVVRLRNRDLHRRRTDPGWARWRDGRLLRRDDRRPRVRDRGRRAGERDGCSKPERADDGGLCDLAAGGDAVRTPRHRRSGGDRRCRAVRGCVCRGRGVRRPRPVSDGGRRIGADAVSGGGGSEAPLVRAGGVRH